MRNETTSKRAEIQLPGDSSFECIKCEGPSKELCDHLCGIFGTARFKNSTPVSTTHLLVQQAARSSSEGFKKLITDGLGMHVAIVLYNKRLISTTISDPIFEVTYLGTIPSRGKVTKRGRKTVSFSVTKNVMFFQKILPIFKK